MVTTQANKWYKPATNWEDTKAINAHTESKTQGIVFFILKCQIQTYIWFIALAR